MFKLVKNKKREREARRALEEFGRMRAFSNIYKSILTM